MKFDMAELEEPVEPSIDKWIKIKLLDCEEKGKSHG